MDNFYPDRNAKSQPLLKIKFTTFGSYNDFGELPQDYTQLIKNISELVFPNNFSLTYLGSDLSTISLNSPDLYVRLEKYVKESNLREVKLLVIVYESSGKTQPNLSDTEKITSITRPSNLLGYKPNYDEIIPISQSYSDKESIIPQERKYSNKKYTKRNSKNHSLSEKNCIKCC
jgi:hypothetical protein